MPDLVIEGPNFDLSGVGPRVADYAMREVAHQIFNDSQIIVPVDTGALKASGKVRKLDNARYQISYGNMKVGYAIPVHQINKRYKTNNPLGQWQYLRQPSQNRQRVREAFIRGARKGYEATPTTG